MKDVGAVFTCCLFPEFTHRAIGSILAQYPDLEIAVVDDACRDHEIELMAIEKDYGISVIRHDRRRGCGRAIDTGMATLTRPILLTVDHGIELKSDYAIEYLLSRMGPDSIGVGMKRGGKKCTRAFGHYIDPFFAVWDLDFIKQEDLSFKLTVIEIAGEGWRVDGCSTAEFLCYRAARLGRRMGFLSEGALGQLVRHHRTPKTRGRCQSDHELVVVEEDYLIPRKNLL